MSYTNILEMLRLAGIPLRSEDRMGSPIVIAGGPCAFSRIPLYAFIDAFSIGDGEEGISTLETIDVVKQCRQGEGVSREGMSAPPVPPARRICAQPVSRVV